MELSTHETLVQELPTNDRISHPCSIGLFGIATFRAMLIDLDCHWFLVGGRTIRRNGHILTTRKLNC
jgi:hypothetical protein